MAATKEQVIKVATLTTALTILVAAVPVITDLADERYVKRGETITLAQADDIKSMASNSHRIAMGNSTKLDRIELQQALAAVWAADDRVRTLKARGAAASEILAAERYHERALEYYECIKEKEPNCERFLGG